MRVIQRLVPILVVVPLLTCAPDATGPSVPESLEAVSDPELAGTVGTELASPVRVRVTGAGGIRLAGVAVDWSVVSGGGQLSPARSVTDADGIAASSWTLGGAAGEQRVRAVVESLPPAEFTALASPGPAAQLMISSPSLEFASLGDSAALAVTEVADGFGNVIDPANHGPPAWTSSDPAVATVDDVGTVTSTGNGEAEIGANVDGAEGTVSVSVAQVAAGVSVEPDLANLEVGLSIELTANAFDANGVGIEDADFDWESSDTSILVVDGSGLATAVVEGEAVITASVGDASGTASLKIIPLRFQALAGDGAVAEAGSGLAEPVRVRVLDEDGEPWDGVSVAFTVLAGGGSIEPATAPTGPAGEATATWTLGPDAAVNRLRLEAGSLPELTIEALGWSLTPRSVTISSLEEIVTVVAMLGEESTDEVELILTAEARWLEEVPVLDEAAAATGTLQPTGAGEVSFATTAFGIDMGEIKVTVLPLSPVVFSIEQPDWPADSTAVVRGFRMDEVGPGSITLDGSVVTLTVTDSASLSLDPGVGATGACEGASLPVEFSGISSVWSGSILQPPAARALALGETVTFEGGTACIKLAGEAGAKYALAQVDGVWVDFARNANEPHWDTLTYLPHTIQVSDASVSGHAAAPGSLRPFGGAASPRSLETATAAGRVTPIPPRTWLSKSVEAVGLPQDGVPPGPQAGASTGLVTGARSGADDFGLWDRATPWVVGDIFTWGAELGLVEVPWLVIGTYDPNFVLAVPEADSDAYQREEVLATLDSLFAYFGSDEAYEIFRTAIGDTDPITSAGSGQLMITSFLHQGFGGSATCHNEEYSSLYMGSLWLGLDGSGDLFRAPNWRGAVRITAHELAHSWDCVNMREMPQTDGIIFPTSARWSVEGLADVLQGEHQRQARDEGPVDGNLPLDPWLQWPSIPHSGDFNSGYSESASFMVYAAWTLWSGYGVPWREAIGAVVRGSAEGWHGHSTDKGPGFTARLRELGDPGWDAIDARLDWMLSLAADDRGQGAAGAFEFPFLFDAWSHVEDQFSRSNVWGRYAYRGLLEAGQAAAVTHHGASGSNGYFLIEDPSGTGLTLNGEADTDTLVWRLLRFQ